MLCSISERCCDGERTNVWNMQVEPAVTNETCRAIEPSSSITRMSQFLQTGVALSGGKEGHHERTSGSHWSACVRTSHVLTGAGTMEAGGHGLAGGCDQHVGHSSH